MTITDQKIYGRGWDPLSPDPQLGNPACVKAVSLMAEAKEQPAGRAGHKHFAIHFSAGVSLGNRTVLFEKKSVLRCTNCCRRRKETVHFINIQIRRKQKWLV